MNLTPFTPNSGRKADTRTFQVLTVVRECGVTVDTETNIVTLTRTATGTVATIDGVATTLDQAVRLLKGAEMVWLEAEVLSAAAPVAARLNKPTAGQRSMNARMTAQEAARLAVQFRAQPYSSFYHSVSEFTGKDRVIKHADALYILEARGLLAETVAA